MLQTLTPSAAREIRNLFAVAGYTEDGYRSKTVLRELPVARSGNIDYLLDATSEPTLFNLVVRLFLFGQDVALAQVRQLVPEPALAALFESAMVGFAGDRIRANVMVVPVGPWLVVSDPLRRMGSDQGADLVLWPNQTTGILRYFAITEPCRSVLDLGAGCGVLSLVASPCAGSVFATDLNPRAAEFVQFNAALNGVSNIQTCTGDTFEPFPGRKFDRILANPPFFVGPSSGVLYCENPLELDEYCRRVVREGAEHLEEGGYLQMVFEWVLPKGQTWQSRLAEWLEGSGCDAWILRTYAGDVASYVYERTRDDYAASKARGRERYAQWTSYLRERGVEEIHGGILAMRRRGGQNWLRIEEGRPDLSGSFGSSVPPLFEAQSVLSDPAGLSAILAARPRLAGGVSLGRHFTHRDGGWTPASLTLTLAGPLPASMAVETQVADFAARCDGKRTVDELARELAQVVNAPLDQVREQCCAVIRKLAERRFVDLSPV